jgi:hypothetical protein
MTIDEFIERNAVEPTPQEQLHVFELADDAVVALDVADAVVVLADHLGLEPENIDIEDVQQVPNDEALSIFVVGPDAAITNEDDADATLELTAREWAVKEGRGHLCRRN